VLDRLVANYPCVGKLRFKLGRGDLPDVRPEVKILKTFFLSLFTDTAKMSYCGERGRNFLLRLIASLKGWSLSELGIFNVL
jgi:hypothetical protein